MAITYVNFNKVLEDTAPKEQPTLVRFDGVWSGIDTTHFFSTNSLFGDSLWVDSFEDGIVALRSCSFAHYGTLKNFFKMLAGCFNENSNLADELQKAFNCDKKTPFTTIKFHLFGRTILVTKENANVEMLLKEWENA